MSTVRDLRNFLANLDDDDAIVRVAVKRPGRREGERLYVDTFEVDLQIPEVKPSFSTMTCTYAAGWQSDGQKKIPGVLILGRGKLEE